jgi:HK97 family phage major capsid protein
MINFLKNQLALRKQELEKMNGKVTDIDSQVRSATEANVVRSLTSELISIKDDISCREKEIADIEAKIAEAEAKKDEERSGGFNPLASYDIKRKSNEERSDDELGTMEYRTAFKDYVQTGKVTDVLQFRNNSTGEIVRANDPNVLADVGVLLPSTVIQEIMKDVEKVYGQLYAKVRKINVRGGVKFPIGSFGATFKRIGEKGAPTDRQNAGKVTGYIEFSWNLGEIRIAKTLLSEVISVPVFEKEIAKVIVEAYVQAMDNEILNGNSANGEMEGILTELAKSDSRIKAENIIEFTADDLKDWKKWQEKLFAVIPLSMRGLKPEFVMTANTYEANIKTLHDDNNRPLWNETFNPVDGTEKATFKARQVAFVEDSFGIKNFNEAEDGEVFALYWVPEKAYCINTNMQFTVRKYFDEELNEYVTKALVINDGKILDPKYLYILKKKVTA